MVATNVIVDWISVTCKQGRIAPYGIPEDGIEADKGLLGYSVRRDMPDGRVILNHPDRPDMGTHVIYSGKALENLRKEYAISDVGLVKFHHRQGHKFTRIDIALDVYDGFTAKEAIERYENEECISPLRVANKNQQIRGKGDTLYIGRRGGDRLMRIYDKAAETKTDGIWTRVEGEYRAFGAIAVVTALTSSPLLQKAIPGILRSTADFPNWKEWKEAMNADVIDMQIGRKETNSTEKWLLEKVAPSLAKFASEHDGFLDDFYKHVEMLIAERK